MMYSYYTLSLLKISCPWKKYLTLSQLAQFLSVLAYSALSLYLMPEEANWTHYMAYGTQVFEMTSLFVLFMHFYSKAYSKKPSTSKASSSNDSEASSEAVATASLSSDSSDEQFSPSES
jgi:elongation of very long chain fatty acids protein 4